VLNRIANGGGGHGSVVRKDVPACAEGRVMTETGLFLSAGRAIAAL
jgi:hypothetical protein